MKSLIKHIALLAIIAVLMVSKSFAASDFLLEIKGIDGECKGKHIKLTENSDGSFTAENIPAGTYEVTYKAKQGKTGSTKRGDGSVTIAFEGVVSPRDVATGQSSGKRQHSPIRITKDWDASTPSLMLGVIVVGDVDGDGAEDRTTGNGTNNVHGVDVKLGATAKGASTTTYDLKMLKK
jgi:hypothetical protein